MPEVRITLDGHHATIDLGGVDIAKLVNGLTIQADAQGQPRVTLNLVPSLRLTLTGQADVSLDEETVEVLHALGWTHPDVKARTGVSCQQSRGLDMPPGLPVVATWNG